MSDEELQQQLKKAFAARHKPVPPDFQRVWAAAEREAGRSRRRYATIGGIAAAAAVIAIVTLSMGNRPGIDTAPDDEYLIADALMNSTGWSAPSDALMPQHQFDIYQELPDLMESTDMQEGSLL